jgi:hypothetical protein
MVCYLLARHEGEINMASYYLHLGFNWDSPTIGSVWNMISSPENTEYRFLQYGVSDLTDLPTWFQFHEDDTLEVRIWDLTPRSSQAPHVLYCDLNMSLGALEVGGAKTYDPSSLLTMDGDVVVQTKSVNDAENYYADFPRVYMSYDSAFESPPWGSCRGKGSSRGKLTFKAVSRFKLSLYLKGVIQNADDGRVFLSDPEVIVGSRG